MAIVSLSISWCLVHWAPEPSGCRANLSLGGLSLMQMVYVGLVETLMKYSNITCPQTGKPGAPFSNMEGCPMVWKGYRNMLSTPCPRPTSRPTAGLACGNLGHWVTWGTVPFFISVKPAHYNFAWSVGQSSIEKGLWTLERLLSS